MKLSGRQPARSPTLSQFSTPFQVSYLGLIRLLCHLWSWGNDASPQWKNGTYTTVVSPSLPNTRFLQRWREKCQLGDKKLRGDLNFEEIVYMFFHKTIVRRLKKKFSSRAVWISTTFGATVFDLLKFKQGHFDLVICNCLAVIFLLLWWQQEQQVLITTSSFFAVVQEEDAAGRAPWSIIPIQHSQTAWWKVAAWGRATRGGVPEMQASLS